MRWPFALRATLDDVQHEMERFHTVWEQARADATAAALRGDAAEAALSALRAEMAVAAELDGCKRRELEMERDVAKNALAVLTERHNRLGAELVAKGREHDAERGATRNALALRDVWKARAERAEQACDDLMEKYHALRATGANPNDPAPAFEIPKSPADALGPLTRAALEEMGQSLGAASKRAMLTKVLALSVDITDDAALAARVRQGEAPRMIAIG